MLPAQQTLPRLLAHSLATDINPRLTFLTHLCYLPPWL